MPSNSEHLKTNLIWCFDVEGNPNVDYLDFLSELNTHLLATDSSYVGLIPWGSQVKGYATRESDFDLCVLSGDSTYAYIGQFSALIMGSAEKYSKKAELGQEPINRKHFTSNLYIHAHEEYSWGYFVELTLLSLPILGNDREIAEYREKARKKHRSQQKFNPKNAMHNYECALNGLWKPDNCHCPYSKDTVKYSESGAKMLARGFTDEEIRAIYARRKVLWKQRLDILLEGDHSELEFDIHALRTSIASAVVVT